MSFSDRFPVRGFREEERKPGSEGISSDVVASSVLLALGTLSPLLGGEVKQGPLEGISPSAPSEPHSCRSPADHRAGLLPSGGTELPAMVRWH